MRRRTVHIWSDIMSFYNRCLLSGSHLGLFSLMKVLKGEMKALEVMLDSTSFFIEIQKMHQKDTFLCIVSPHPALEY